MSQSTIQTSKRHLLWTVVECIFLLAIWFPNISYLFTYVPKLCNPPVFTEEIREHPWAFADFVKYYALGDLARQDQQEGIWDPKVQEDWIKKSIGQMTGQKQELRGVGEYTPQFVVLMMPWTCLPFNQALGLWLLVSLFVLIVPITFILKRHNKITTTQMILWWLVLLASGPCWFNFFLGQSAALVAGLLACYFLSWSSERDILAGLALTFMVLIKPQRAVIPVLMAIFTRRWRILISAFVSSVALLCFAAQVLGWHTIIHYPTLVARIFHGYDTGEYFGQLSTLVSLQGPLSVLLGRQPVRIILSVTQVFGILGICYVWWKAAKAGKQSYVWAFTATLLLDFVVSAHALYYDLLGVAVAWALTVPNVEFDAILKIKDKRYQLWCWLFVLFPAINWIILFSKIYDGGPMHFPVLVLLCVVAFWNLAPLLKTTAVARTREANGAFEAAPDVESGTA